MIKSEKGLVDISGDNGDVIIEWVHLFSMMIENQPEIVIETCLAFENEMLNTSLNPLVVSIVHAIVDTIKGDFDNE